MNLPKYTGQTDPKMAIVVLSEQTGVSIRIPWFEKKNSNRTNSKQEKIRFPCRPVLRAISFLVLLIISWKGGRVYSQDFRRIICGSYVNSKLIDLMTAAKLVCYKCTFLFTILDYVFVSLQVYGCFQIVLWKPRLSTRLAKVNFFFVS